jgi:transcriptional regulator with XRE-family HTH domain
VVERARVSYAYISRAEAGTRRPSVYALRALARALAVTAEGLEFGHRVSPEVRAAARTIARLERRLAGAERRARQYENDLRALRRAIAVEPERAARF